MLLFRGWSIELGPVSRRYIAWSQNYFTHILSLANDKIYGLHYFPEPKRLQAKFSTCSSYNRQKQHRRNRNWAHKCIYFYTTLDGWMDKQTGSKSDKNYINVILLTFLSIKSKTISAIAKHIIRLGHHYYRSLCTHTYPVFVALYSMFGHLETSPVGERSLVQSGLIRSQRCGGGVGWVMLTALNWHQDWLSSVALLAIDGFRKSDGVCLIKHCTATT